MLHLLAIKFKVLKAYFVFFLVYHVLFPFYDLVKGYL
jgi:hypothetical protein